MATPTDISSTVASSSSIEKENTLVGALSFLSRSLLLPTDVLRIVSEIDHDPTAHGHEQNVDLHVEILNHPLAAMQIQQPNNSSCSGIRNSLVAACFTTSAQRRPRSISQLQANTFYEMSWMISRFRGKTIQTIAPITYLIRKRGVTGPHLIIAPEPALSFWQSEFQFWLPRADILSATFDILRAANAFLDATVSMAALNISKVALKISLAFFSVLCMTTLLYDGPEHRKTIREACSGNVTFDVLLTHYSLMVTDREVLSKIGWYFLIVDGGHVLRSNRLRVPLHTTMKAYDYRSSIMVQKFFL